MKKILLSLMAVFAALGTWAQDFTQLANLDFEDDAPVFVADSRITVSVVTDATLNSKVAKFVCARNAQNGYSFSHYSFKDALYGATDIVKNVKIELDYYNTNGGRAILSIGDADVRGTTGNSAKTTYSNKGAIFALGSDKNNSLLNGAKGKLDTYTNLWMHLVVNVDVNTKTYSYVISKKEDGSEISSEENVSFYSADAQKCTQIDLFGYINNSQCAYIDNVNVSYIGEKAQKANFTIKYVCDGAEVKQSETVEGIVGAVPELLASKKDNFSANGKKYIYVSDNAAEQTVAADGTTVVTVTFREAASYVVNAKFNGNVISTANVFEGDEAYVYAPYYQLVEGKLYNTPAVDKGTLSYGQVKLSNVTADTDINVTYTEDATQNAVFYAEGEDIATCTPVKDGFTEIRMSNGAAGYADNSVITTLEPGVYTLTTSTRSGITNFTVNGVNVKTLTSTGAVVTETSPMFTVQGTSELIATCDKKTSYFDYVLIRKVGEAPKNTIAAGKYTLTADVALAEGVTEEIVPADFKKYVGTYTSNATLAGDENSLTISENDENGLFAGFEIQGDAVVLSAGKTITLNGKVFNVRTAADAENGSLAITAEGDNYKMDAANVWYNGQKVATISNIVIKKFTVPGTSGIKNVTAAKARNAKFIENGKLVIISNGKKFTVAGQAL